MTRRLLVGLVIVSACSPFFAGVATASTRAAPGIPANLPAKLFGAYGNRAYVPTSIPQGYVYLKWRNVDDHSSQQSTYDNLNIEFGRAGSLLEWRVDTPSSSFDCLHSYPDRTSRINGLVVSFASGNHGQDAWTCVGHGPTMFEIDAWDPHTLSPATLIGIVASARQAVNSKAMAPRSAGVPATYVGGFGSVDGRERCFATTNSVICVSALSRQTVQMIAYKGAEYLGKGPVMAERGPRMPEGTSFTTPSGKIRCVSGSFGIHCMDDEAAAFFIGDHYVRLIETDAQKRIVG